jgi:hypothetical protein
MSEETGTELVEFSNNTAMAEFEGVGASLNAKDVEDSTGVKPLRYFPYIQMKQPTSQGDFGQAGEFILMVSGKDKSPTNLSNTFEARILSIRGKATHWDGETVRAEYDTATNRAIDPDTKEVLNEKFGEYRDMAKKGSGPANPYKCGVDLLLYIPDAGGKSCFATYFANSTTAVAAVETKIASYTNENVNFTSTVPPSGKGRFFIPDCEPLAEVNWTSGVTRQELEDAYELFNNPPARVESQIEGAEKAEAPSRDR